MRTLIVRAAIATVFVPVAASAQSLSLTESEALARLSADSPRVQAIRASVGCGTRGCAGRGALAESSIRRQPRVVCRHHRVHHDDRAGASDHRPARSRRQRGIGPSRRRREPGRRGDSPSARRCPAGVRGPRRRTEPRERASRRGRTGPGARRGDREARGRGRRRRLRSPSRRARSAGRRCGWIGGRRGPGQGPGGADRILRRSHSRRDHRRAAGTHTHGPACA